MSTSTVDAPRSPRRGLWYRLYHGETTFDFNGRRWVGFAISGALILVSVLALATRGLNLGIDFEGGVVWDVPADDGFTVDEAREVLEPFGLDDAEVQTVSGSEGERVRIQAGPQAGEEQEVTAALAEAAGVDVEGIGLTSVGPSWGEAITEKAVRALVVFFLLITLYISVRFEWRMAVGALAAVLHDIVISVGVYALTGFEVTPATVIAFLTILGFSLYDTIVVFDKVKENTRRVSSRFTYGDVVNLSMNQTLMRSLNTSLAAILPVLSLLLVGAVALGAVTLQEFAIALLVGLFIGAYSSIAIATPVLAVLKEREPRYRDLKRRAQSRPAAAPAAGARVAAARQAVGSADDDEPGAGAEPGRVPAGATVGRAAGDGEARQTRAGGQARPARQPAASGATAAGAARPRPRAAGRPANQPPRPRKKGRRR